MNINVCGLSSKLENEIFLNECLDNDILCLCECKTRAVEEEKVAKVLGNCGFTTYIKSRTNVKAKSGGLVVAVKNKIAHKVKQRKCKEDFIQIFSLDKSLTNTDKDVVLLHVYIPPKNSLYSDIQMFDILEQVIITNNLDDNFILLNGDLNAHVQTRNDLIEFCDTLGFETGLGEENMQRYTRKKQNSGA